MKASVVFLRNLFLRFIGKEESFSLEHRIFHLFCFFTGITTFVSFIINIAFGLYESAIVSLTAAIIQLVVSYLSRIEGKLNLALIITGIELHILLIINYFVNAGITGPTTVLFLAVLFWMISIAEKKGALFWLLLNVGLIAILFGVEYYYPQSILVGYGERIFMFGDVYFTYILVVILIATGILYKRRAYERQQKVLEAKASALEKLNAEKTKLFSIISHDLRAPVGSVKQYLSFLKENTLTDDEKLIIEEGLIKSTDEAYELLDNLLIWAKSQMGGAKPFITRLKVKEVLVGILDSVKDHAKKKGIAFTSNISDIEIVADEHMLQLVIRNLLFNAVKFSEVNGEILFEVYSESGRAIFKVKDDGVGISEENKRWIFSLDVKSNVGTKKEKGTGLGLVLCKEYTQLQDGKIWFESERGKGSTFYVSLPLYKP